MRLGVLGLVLLAAACSSGGGAPPPIAPGADLSGFQTARIMINGVELEVWLARTAAQQQQGLMNATADQLAPLPDGTERGMLFLFTQEVFLGFFMRDTFVPLDLAYATGDAMIVETHQLVPLDETTVWSGQPVQFALEVVEGVFGANGIGPGAVIEIPAEVLDP